MSEPYQHARICDCWVGLPCNCDFSSPEVGGEGVRETQKFVDLQAQLQAITQEMRTQAPAFLPAETILGWAGRLAALGKEQP